MSITGQEKSVYAFSRKVTVWDAEALHEQALAHFLAAGGTEENAREYLRHVDGRPNVEACLTELMDATLSGCTTLSSGAQSV